MPFGPHDTAAGLFQSKQACVFLWSSLSGGAVQTHKLRFGVPHEVVTARCDVFEATFELVRQFGEAFATTALVVHVSINSVLLSGLRACPAAVATPSLQALRTRGSIRDVAVQSIEQLLATLEFLRLSLQEMQEQLVPGTAQSPRALVVFSGLNPLLVGQDTKTLEQVASCLAQLAEQRDVLVAWITAADSASAAATSDSPAAPFRRVFADRSSYIGSDVFATKE